MIGGRLRDTDRGGGLPQLVIRVTAATADATCGRCGKTAVDAYVYPVAPWRLNRCAKHTAEQARGLRQHGHTVIDRTARTETAAPEGGAGPGDDTKGTE